MPPPIQLATGGQGRVPRPGDGEAARAPGGRHGGLHAATPGVVPGEPEERWQVWHLNPQIYRGSEDSGELLAAFELFELGDSDRCGHTTIKPS